MKNVVNKIIMATGFIYLVEAVLLKSSVVMPLCVFLGIWLLSACFLKPQELKKNTIPLIVITILSFFLNIIAFVLLIVAFTEFKSIKEIRGPTEKVLDASTKRLDVLLKLGVLMILVSGILLATTNWSIITNLTKVIGLVIIGFIFLGLSKFSELHLKIIKTTKAYYLLGLAFIFLAVVAFFHFEIISQFPSYKGIGAPIAYAITFLILSIICLFIKRKFKENEYLYFSIFSFNLVIYYFLKFLGLTTIYNIIILSIICLIINFFSKKKHLEIQNISKVLSFFYPLIIIFNQDIISSFGSFIFTLITIANLLLLTSKTKDSFLQIASNIISYLLIIICISSLNLISNKVLLFVILISIYYLILEYGKIIKDEKIRLLNQIIYHTLTIISLINLIYSPDLKIDLLIASAFYFLVNQLNVLYNDKFNKFSFKIQPLVIYTFVFSIFKVFNVLTFPLTNNSINVAVSSLLYAICHFLTKDEKNKEYYFLWSIVTLLLSTFLNGVTQMFGNSLLCLVIAIYVLLCRKDKVERILAYVFVLVNLFSTVYSFDLLKEFGILANTILILILSVLTLLVKNINMKKINLFAIAIPLISIINILELSHTTYLILLNIFQLYILALFIYLVIKDSEGNPRDILAAAGVVVILLEIIFNGSLNIGIYIGVLTIALIFLTFSQERYKKLFYSSIVLTILNIFVQLWDYFVLIPFWVYLFISGILIVVFVMYKETHKKEIPLTKNTKNIEKEAPLTKEYADFCPKCGMENEGGKFCSHCGESLEIKK